MDTGKLNRLGDGKLGARQSPSPPNESNPVEQRLAFQAMTLLCGSQLRIGCTLLDPLYGGQIFGGDLWKGL